MRERTYFCPGCGKEIKKNEEFCFDCKPRKELEFRDTNIKFCLNCDKLNILNNWGKFETFEEATEQALKKSIKSKDYIIEDIEIPEVERKPGLQLEATAKIIFDNQEFLIPIHIQVTTCPSCSKITEQYIEGILQLRNCKPEVKEFIYHYVEQFRDKGVNINQENVVKGGEDFVFNNKKVMRRLAQQMKKKFEHKEFKEAAQHFSQNRDGIVYRLNILFRQ